MHSGMYGMYALQESVRQMRGTALAQTLGAKISVCHGVSGMFAASGTIILSKRVAVVRCLSQSGRRKAPVRGWDGASEETAQKIESTGWSADKERRASHVVGGRGPAVIEERLLAGERAGDLIAQRVRRALLADRTGADDLVFRQGLIETRE